LETLKLHSSAYFLHVNHFVPELEQALAGRIVASPVRDFLLNI